MAKMATILTTVDKVYRVVSENINEISKRKSNLSGVEDFFLSLVHWAMQDEYNCPSANKFGGKLISYDRPIMFKLTYDENGMIEVHDGLHRLKFLTLVFSDMVKIPEQSPVTGYDWIVKKYKNKTFGELPLVLQEKIKNTTAIVSVLESGETSDKSALFHSDNCGRPLSSYDSLKNNYFETHMWSCVEEAKNIIASKTYNPNNYLELNKQDWIKLNQSFGKKANNLTNFFVRNMVGKWSDNSQFQISDSFFRENFKKSESYVKKRVKSMLRILSESTDYIVVEDKGLTLYTAMIVFLGSLDSSELSLLKKKKKEFSKAISSWLMFGTSGPHSNENMLSYMNNNYQDYNRLAQCLDFYFDTLNRFKE